jgi:hypothetical protein
MGSKSAGILISWAITGQNTAVSISTQRISIIGGGIVERREAAPRHSLQIK